MKLTHQSESLLKFRPIKVTTTIIVYRLKCCLQTATVVDVTDQINYVMSVWVIITSLADSTEYVDSNQYKNSNTIRMILTKSRRPVEGLHIIQVN